MSLLLYYVTKLFLKDYQYGFIFNDVNECSCNKIDLSPDECINKNCKYLYKDDDGSLNSISVIKLLENENLVNEAKKIINEFENKSDECDSDDKDNKDNTNSDNKDNNINNENSVPIFNVDINDVFGDDDSNKNKDDNNKDINNDNNDNSNEDKNKVNIKFNKNELLKPKIKKEEDNND